jgi:hypothetical protein
MALAMWLLPVPGGPQKMALSPSVMNFSACSSKQVRRGISGL